MSRLTDEMIDRFIEGLAGTCQSWPEAFSISMEFYFPDSPIQEMEDLTAEEESLLTSRLDDSLFCCAQCGWWFEVGYWNSHNPDADTDGDTCLDCMPEDDD